MVLRNMRSGPSFLATAAAAAAAAAVVVVVVNDDDDDADPPRGMVAGVDRKGDAELLLTRLSAAKRRHHNLYIRNQ